MIKLSIYKKTWKKYKYKKRKKQNKFTRDKKNESDEETIATKQKWKENETF